MALNGYNVSIDYINLLIAGLFLFVMCYTRPRKTLMFRLNLSGIILSIVHMVLHIIIIANLSVPNIADSIIFKILMLVYYAVYGGILTGILMYFNQLSSEHKTEKHSAASSKFFIWVNIVYIAIGAALLFFDFVIAPGENGIAELKFGFHYNVFYGMLVAFILFCNRLKIGYSMSKIVKNLTIIFIPLDFILLAMQFVFPKISVIGITYIMPFLIFYIIFHSTPFDESSGTQNRYSFESHFLSKNDGIESSLIIVVHVPKLEKMNLADFTPDLNAFIASLCRSMDTVTLDARIYNLDKSTFALYTHVTDSASVIHIESRLREVLSVPITIDGKMKHFDYKGLILTEIKGVTTYEHLYEFINYLLKSLKGFNRNLIYHATQDDFDNYYRSSLIEKELLDIYRKNDLNDERVICYVQPIFDVKSNSFRTGEALMRLCLDGKMVFPDQFIPIAEENNYIHVLTCIILNKVCKKIRSYHGKYDFDAISVNCSTTEFTDPNLHDELLNIIYSNGVPCSKIRLELTESASAENIETVKHNMDVLKNAGVNFYLDDFGTGYSNLSRILSLPFHTIKFDKSLLYKSIEDEHIDRLFSSMADTFKSSGLLLLVEGVEDEAQSDYVIGYNFDFIQGYKYAKPLIIDEFEKFLTLSKDA